MQYFLFAVVVLVLLVILWNRHTKIQLKTQNQRMEQQKNMQYRYFSERIAQNKVLYDLHNQSVAQWTEIVALAKKQDDAALRTVLSALDTQYESMPRMVFCDNVIVNAVLAQRLCRMEQDSIRFAHQLRIPEQIGIQDVDLMCLFSNIMDNAIEACEELPENLQRWIRLQATLRSGLLLLTCENSAQPSAGNPLASSKQNTEHTASAYRLSAIFVGAIKVNRRSKCRLIASMSASAYRLRMVFRPRTGREKDNGIPNSFRVHRGHHSSHHRHDIYDVAVSESLYSAQDSADADADRPRTVSSHTLD